MLNKEPIATQSGKFLGKRPERENHGGKGAGPMPMTRACING